jgi:hypothetical protein
LSGNIFVVEEKFLIHSQRMQREKGKTYLMKNVRKIYKIRKLSFIYFFLRKMSKVEEIEE